jgi:phosphoribosylformylglycinamidine synthase
VPSLDLTLETAVQATCLAAIRQGLVQSAHDCSEGGLAVALAEACFSSYGREAIGASIDLSAHAAACALDDPATLLFAESPSRILLSVAREQTEQVLALARDHDVPCLVLGVIGGDQLRVSVDGRPLVEAPVASLESAWRSSLARHLDRPE